MRTDPDCMTYSTTKKCADPIQTFDSSQFKTIIHPDYNKATAENDIALIILNEPVKLSESISPICLPFDNEEIPESIEVIGFGTNEKNRKPFSNILMQIRVDVISNEDCLDRYKNVTTRNIPETNFCANGKSSNDLTTDSCQGKVKKKLF